MSVRLSWPGFKQQVFGLAFVILAYLLMEVFSYGAYWILKGQSFSWREASALRLALITDNTKDKDFSSWKGVAVPWNVPLHPYTGFGNPQGFSFLENDSPEQSDPTGVVVGITGGSVSYGLYSASRETLARAIKDTRVFGGRKVYVIQLGYFAWKQPQQLESVAYYLSMGGKLDVLINLDGYNEVVDTRFNRDHGVFVAYPWLWYHLTSNIASAEQVRLVGKISVMRDIRRVWARRAQRVRYSMTANILWKLSDDVINSIISGVYEELTQLEKDSSRDLPFYRSGPKGRLRTDDELLDVSANIWRDASLQLHRLSVSNHIRYFHFLQPNQYVAGTKQYTAEELRTAYRPPNEGISKGYPLLGERGRYLVSNGVDFRDLTAVFVKVKETVYVDSCCHVNKLGNDLMAKAIALHIKTNWSTH